MRERPEQGDEADEAFGGTRIRGRKVPPHARAGRGTAGHRFAAYRRCSADAGVEDGGPGERAR